MVPRNSTIRSFYFFCSAGLKNQWDFEIEFGDYHQLANEILESQLNYGRKNEVKKHLHNCFYSFRHIYKTLLEDSCQKL